MALDKGNGDTRPLDRRNVMVIGSGGLAKSMIFGITKRKGLVIVTSSNDKEAQALAIQMGVRFVPYQNLYNTLADVVVFADPNLQLGGKKDEFNLGYLRASMMTIDVTTMPGESPVMKEAREPRSQNGQPRRCLCRATRDAIQVRDRTRPPRRRVPQGTHDRSGIIGRRGRSNRTTSLIKSIP